MWDKCAADVKRLIEWTWGVINTALSLYVPRVKKHGMQPIVGIWTICLWRMNSNPVGSFLAFEGPSSDGKFPCGRNGTLCSTVAASLVKEMPDKDHPLMSVCGSSITYITHPRNWASSYILAAYLAEQNPKPPNWKHLEHLNDLLSLEQTWEKRLFQCVYL